MINMTDQTNSNCENSSNLYFIAAKTNLKTNRLNLVFKLFYQAKR